MLEVQKTWWECSPELYAAIAPELLRLQSGMAFAVLQQGPTSCSCSDAAMSSFIIRVPTLCVVYRGVTGSFHKPTVHCYCKNKVPLFTCRSVHVHDKH